jgi:hypothetical protein
MQKMNLETLLTFLNTKRAFLINFLQNPVLIEQEGLSEAVPIKNSLSSGLSISAI